MPVITSSPNPETRASTGVAPHLVTRSTSGMEAAAPIRPPAALMAGRPPENRGVPEAMWARPSAPTTSADQPITIRAVAALLSGWRRKRHASSASSNGTVHAPEPKNATRNLSTGLTGPVACHQVAAAAMIAPHSAVRPTPSRRCSGSRSLALGRATLATDPTVWASAIQMPVSKPPSQPTRMTNGLVDLGRLGRRLGGLRPAGRLVPLR